MKGLRGCRTRATMCDRVGFASNVIGWTRGRVRVPSDREEALVQLIEATGRYLASSQREADHAVASSIEKQLAALSAAATARPDWEAIARELYEALAGMSTYNVPPRRRMARAKALTDFESASLGEGEGGR
jgi:hypothetical protein